MLAAREEILSRRQQFMPAGVHGNGVIQQLRSGFGRRKDTVNQRRKSSGHVRRRLQQLRSGAGCELQRRRRWKQQGSWNLDGDPLVTWFASQAKLAPWRDRNNLVLVRDLTVGAARVRLMVERPPIAASRPFSNAAAAFEALLNAKGADARILHRPV
jgi:hypothetical protein